MLVLKGRSLWSGVGVLENLDYNAPEGPHVSKTFAKGELLLFRYLMPIQWRFGRAHQFSIFEQKLFAERYVLIVTSVQPAPSLQMSSSPMLKKCLFSFGMRFCHNCKEPHVTFPPATGFSQWDQFPGCKASMELWVDRPTVSRKGQDDSERNYTCGWSSESFDA